MLLSPAIYDATVVGKFSQQPSEVFSLPTGLGAQAGVLPLHRNPSPHPPPVLDLRLPSTSCRQFRRDGMFIMMQKCLSEKQSQAFPAPLPLLNWLKSPRWGRCDAVVSVAGGDVTRASSLKMKRRRGGNGSITRCVRLAVEAVDNLRVHAQTSLHLLPTAKIQARRAVLARRDGADA